MISEDEHGTRPLIDKPPVTVIVLFHPSDADLANVIRLADGGPVIAVINAIAQNPQTVLPASHRLSVIHNRSNMGLAHALNQGIKAAFDQGTDHVLLLDQDSRPDPGMIDRLTSSAKSIEAQQRQLACVAPLLHDRKFGQLTATPAACEICDIPSFATSGTLITRSGWEHVGPMWDALFIDGIDHEWCFRARAKGMETVQIPSVVMEHDMGEDAINLLGRFKPIHRSPIRHYFIVRNTLWLIRQKHIPLNWRRSEFLKLAYRVPAYVFFSKARAHSVKNLTFAVIDGMRGKPLLQRFALAK